MSKAFLPMVLQGKPLASIANFQTGVPSMDRLNLLHTGARIDLPNSFQTTDFIESASPSRHGRPLVGRCMAVFGFITCGAVVITAASAIALTIQ